MVRLEVQDQAEWQLAFEQVSATQERYYAARVTDMEASVARLLGDDHRRALEAYIALLHRLDA